MEEVVDQLQWKKYDQKSQKEVTSRMENVVHQLQWKK